MLKFRTPQSNEPLFEAIYTVDREMTKISPVQVLFPKEGKISNDLSKIVVERSFPLANNGCVFWDSATTIHVVNVPQKGQRFLFVKYAGDRNKVTATLVLSSFLHIRLIEKVFDLLSKPDSEKLLKDFSTIAFQQEYCEVTCKSTIPECPIPFGVSADAEVGYLYQYFLQRFSPSYAALLISMLALNQRVFVVGSSTASITQSIFSIISLFYPIMHPANVFSLIRSPSDLENISGASIIGVHASLMTQLTDKVKEKDVFFNVDDPYVSCAQPPKFPPGVYPKIFSFQGTIKAITKNMQPSFPAKLIYYQIIDFIMSFMEVILALDKRTVAEIKSCVSKIKENSTTIEGDLARSLFMKEFLERTGKNDKGLDTYIHPPNLESLLIKRLKITSESTSNKPSLASHKKHSKTFLGFFNK